MISRDHAIRILRAHSFRPDEPTSWWPETGLWDFASTFDREMGIRTRYRRRDVYNWLGY